MLARSPVRDRARSPELQPIDRPRLRRGERALSPRAIADRGRARPRGRRRGERVSTGETDRATGTDALATGDAARVSVRTASRRSRLHVAKPLAWKSKRSYLLGLRVIASSTRDSTRGVLRRPPPLPPAPPPPRFRRLRMTKG